MGQPRVRVKIDGDVYVCDLRACTLVTAGGYGNGGGGVSVVSATMLIDPHRIAFINSDKIAAMGPRANAEVDGTTSVGEVLAAESEVPLVTIDESLRAYREAGWQEAELFVRGHIHGDFLDDLTEAAERFDIDIVIQVVEDDDDGRDATPAHLQNRELLDEA